ncbi:MAG: S9 family peptidase [Planctomycetota bacterium]|nr:S9 family peptidase [Planctomycetota bacterium]
MTDQPRAYGLWESAVTPRLLAQGRHLKGVCWDSDGQTLVWLEERSGRGVLVAQSTTGEAPNDVTSDHNVRAEVGYGGGDFTAHGGQVFFVGCPTGQLFRQAIGGGGSRVVTPQFGKIAAPTVSPDGRYVVYVHSDGQQDCIALVDTDGAHWPQRIASGHDFYMQPRWNADGSRLAWIAWDHPNMPWDGTVLEWTEVTYGPTGLPQVTAPRVAAGGPDVAIFQPEFLADGRLVYVSDELQWGRLAVQELDTGVCRWLSATETEFALPAWSQDMRSYAVAEDGQSLFAVANRSGYQSLEQIEIATGAFHQVEPLALYSEISQLAVSPQGNSVAILGSGPRNPPRVVSHQVGTSTTRVVARALSETVDRDALADCQPVCWPTAGGETAHGLLMWPAGHPELVADKPPLVVMVHGGPTSQVRAGWRGEGQFLATRGYAVLFVNYRGSTGYGRDYMLRLRGNWGICDVEDALSGRQWLIDTERVDAERTVIMGGSAGGFTVLQTLVEHPQAFAAGIDLYGVADQFGLAAETHKFESRYTDSLLGPLPAAAAVYRARSPVFGADRIERPLAVFQGELDRVVPRNQSDRIAATLQKNGVPHVYHVYPEEGHGWRQAATIEHFFQELDSFLRKYVIYQQVDSAPPSSPKRSRDAS